jgi:hypothetical protein
MNKRLTVLAVLVLACGASKFVADDAGPDVNIGVSPDAASDVVMADSGPDTQDAADEGWSMSDADAASAWDGDAAASDVDIDVYEAGPPPSVCCQLTSALYSYTVWCGCNDASDMHGFTGNVNWTSVDSGGTCYSTVPSAYGDCTKNYACSVSVQGGGFGTGYCQ